jgi:hypothetical protein
MMNDGKSGLFHLSTKFSSYAFEASNILGISGSFISRRDAK